MDILKLKNDKKIRNIIMAGGEAIKIYEPSPEHINIILSLQERWTEKDQIKIEFPAAVLVRELFPLLTDIKGIDKLTDEELQDIIEKPSVAFSAVQVEIETIIIEIFNVILLNAKYQLTLTDYQAEAYKANVEGFEKTLASVAKSTGSADLYDKVDQWADNVIHLQDQEKKSEESNRIQLLDKEIEATKQANQEAVTSPINNSTLELLERYKSTFADGESDKTI